MIKSVQSSNLNWITSFYNNIPLFHHSIIPPAKFAVTCFKIKMVSISFRILEPFINKAKKCLQNQPDLIYDIRTELPDYHPILYAECFINSKRFFYGKKQFA